MATEATLALGNATPGSLGPVFFAAGRAAAMLVRPLKALAAGRSMSLAPGSAV